MLRLLAESPIPRDALPYTDEFDRLKSKYERHNNTTIGDADFWQLLSRIGKFGGAAKEGGRKRAPRTPTLTHEQQLEILRLLPDGTGRRDDLPYTEKFDELYRRFNKLTRSSLTKHEFWRGMSRVAKLSRKPKPVLETGTSAGLSQGLVESLERMNPWWFAKPMPPTARFRRWAFQEVIGRIKSGIAPVIALRGPRQVGKTTIQMQMVEHLLHIVRIDSRRIIRVQFDDLPELGSLTNPVEAIVRWYETHVLKDTINAYANRGEFVYVLFDELQNLPQWSDLLKSLVDHTSAHFFVTGSSALRIRKGSDSLAGRINMLELGTLRLGEIAELRRLGDLAPFTGQTLYEDWREKEFWLDLVEYGHKHRVLRRKAFDLYSTLGGYPRCHDVDDDANLAVLRQGVVNAVIEKTIQHDATARRAHTSGTRHFDPRTLREVFRLVCRYAGQAVKNRRLAEELQPLIPGGVKETMIDEAIGFLADSLLLHRIQPLEMLQKAGANPPKLCICDHFVRDGVLQETIPISPKELKNANDAVCTQAGHIVESIVGYYLRGMPGIDVAWFPVRSKEPEIDFVVSLGMQRLPIEVKYRRTLDATADCDGLRTFTSKQHYEAPFGIVITQDEAGEVDEKIVAVPASTFLLLK